MKITIGRKLTAGCLLVVVVMAALAAYAVSVSETSLRKSVGRTSIFLAREMLRRIEANTKNAAEQLQLFAEGMFFKECLFQSNGEKTPDVQRETYPVLSRQIKKEFFEFWERHRGHGRFAGVFVATEGNRKKLFSYVRTNHYGPGKDIAWILMVGHDENEVLKPVFRLRDRIVQASLILIIGVFLLVFFLSRSISKPIERLRKGAEIVGSGNLDYHVATEARDEIGELSRGFDGMIRNLEERTAELKAMREQAFQSQKMEAVGRLAGGVAHDFNNFLTPILGYAQMALMKLPEKDPLREYLSEIKQAAESASALTGSLLVFSRKQALQPKVLVLNGVVARLVKMLGGMIGEDVRLRQALAPDLGRVRVDPVRMEQVLMNLAINARDAMPKGGALTFETADVDLDGTYVQERGKNIPPGPYVMLAVSDTGMGMDEETRSHIFEPFFTTKEKGKGTGLGLSTVYGIIKQSGGVIWVYSEPDAGTTFKIYLPRVDGKATPVREEKPFAGGASSAGKTILLAEDENAVRKVVKLALEQSGRWVLEAEDGEAALGICEAHEGAIHLLLTDVIMPKMTGRELADRVTALRPEIRVLFMSGYTDNVIADHGILNAGVNFLEKPFSPEKLLAAVGEVLE